MKTLFINNTELLSPEWRFIAPQWTDPRADWRFFHGVPQNRLEHLIRKPNAARYRAAFQATRSAASARDHRPILVSHLPAMTATTNAMRRMICPDVRHIAFAFNFTDLPTGARLSYFRRALAGVDEFVVFSEAEREIYSRSFGIPQDRLRMLHWAMDTPVPGPENPVPFKGPYLCAVGGEGRDYALLAEVMRHLPELKLAVVARPYSIAGLNFPDNIHVFTNLPSPQTWRLAQDSMGLVIPLKSNQTACGHITIVGAQLLNIPLVVTRSAGVADYVSEETAFLTAASSVPEMTQALRVLSQGQAPVRQRQHKALQVAQGRSNLETWVRYFENTLS